MGISGQTIWRQTGNFLRKQKIIRKITYYESGFRKLNGAIQNGHKTLNTRNMKIFTEDHFIADGLSIQWCVILSEADDVDILVEESYYICRILQ